jgi:hypothetical protein
MRYIIFVTLILFSASAYAQKTEQPKPETDTVTVKMTEWQAQQLLLLDQQRQIIEDKARLLITTILDANKIKPEDVKDMAIKSPDIIVVRTKPK